MNKSFSHGGSSSQLTLVLIEVTKINKRKKPNNNNNKTLSIPFAFIKKKIQCRPPFRRRISERGVDGITGKLKVPFEGMNMCCTSKGLRSHLAYTELLSLEVHGEQKLQSKWQHFLVTCALYLHVIAFLLALIFLLSHAWHFQQKLFHFIILNYQFWFLPIWISAHNNKIDVSVKWESQQPEKPCLTSELIIRLL